MLDKSEWAAIASNLIKLTREGRVSWEVADSPPEVLYMQAARSVFRVYSVDGDGRYPYALDVYRRQGEDESFTHLDTYTTKARTSTGVGVGASIATTAASLLHEANEAKPDWDIESLYALALRSASGSADQAKAILEELEELGQDYHDIS